MEKYGTARQATADNIIRRMRIVRWIKNGKNTDIYSEYVILISFPRQLLPNVSHLYAMLTFSVLF